MGTEIERKFVVRDCDYLRLLIDSNRLVNTKQIVQAYLTHGDPEVRVRHIRHIEKGVKSLDQLCEAMLTIKVKTPQPIKRGEFEYPIVPLDDVFEIINAVNCAVFKTRYTVEINDAIWEIDIFERANVGLILAEIELSSVDEKVIIPDFVVREVTGLDEFTNASLADFPVADWEENMRKEFQP